MTKLSPHEMLGGSDTSYDVTAAIQSPVVKIVGDFGALLRDGRPLLAALKALPHRPVIVGNALPDYVVGPPNSADEFLQRPDPIAEARHYFATRIQPAMARWPDVDAWEVCNEPVTNTIESVRWLSKFLIESTRLVVGAGRRIVAGNFSVGTPHLPEADRLAFLREYQDLVRVLNETHSFLGLHEYFSENRAWDSWLALRYRWWLKLATPPKHIVVTECGLDHLPDGGKPFRDYYGGDGRRYVDLLAWYDSELARDAALIGACVFTFGAGGSSAWLRHDVVGSDFPARLIERFKTVTAPPPVSLVGRWAVIRTNLRLRPMPSTLLPSRTTLFTGTRLPIAEERDGWVRVTSDGWVKNEPAYLRIE